MKAVQSLERAEDPATPESSQLGQRSVGNKDDVGHIAVANYTNSPEAASTVALSVENMPVSSEVKDASEEDDDSISIGDLLDFYTDDSLRLSGKKNALTDNSEQLSDLMQQAVEIRMPYWASPETRLRPTFHLDKLKLRTNEASSAQKRKNRQSYALSAAHQILEFVDEHGVPGEGSDPIVFEKDALSVTYEQGINGIRALGNIAQPPLSDITLAEVDINHRYDALLIDTIKDLAEQGDIDHDKMARLLLGLRESFLSADEYKKLSAQIESELRPFDRDVLASAYVADSTSEATAYAIYDVDGKLLMTLAYEQALMVLAKALVIKATMLSQEYKLSDLRLLALASKINSAGIYVSNWRDDAKVGGKGLCELPNAITDKSVAHQNLMIEVQHGVISKLSAVQDPENGEWTIVAVQEDCPPCAEKADVMLEKNFEPISIDAVQPKSEIPQEFDNNRLIFERNMRYIQDEMGYLAMLNEQTGSLPVRETPNYQPFRPPSRQKIPPASQFIEADEYNPLNILDAQPVASAQVSSVLFNNPGSGKTFAEVISYNPHEPTRAAMLARTFQQQPNSVIHVSGHQGTPNTWSHSYETALVKAGVDVYTAAIAEIRSLTPMADIEIGSKIRVAIEAVHGPNPMTSNLAAKFEVDDSSPILTPTEPKLFRFGGLDQTGVDLAKTGPAQSNNDQTTSLLDEAFQTRTTLSVVQKSAQIANKRTAPANHQARAIAGTATKVSSKKELSSIITVDLSKTTDDSFAASNITPLNAPSAHYSDDEEQPTAKTKTAASIQRERGSATLSMRLVPPGELDTSKIEDVRNRLNMFLHKQSLKAA